MPTEFRLNRYRSKTDSGATFEKKVSAGKITVAVVEGGCVVLFASIQAAEINTANNSIVELSQ
jgi:hypothetical protein